MFDSFSNIVDIIVGLVDVVDIVLTYVYEHPVVDIVDFSCPYLIHRAMDIANW